MSVAETYLDAILHRGRVGMEPIGFEPNWADRPRKGKFYAGVHSYPMPLGRPTEGRLEDGLFGAAPPTESGTPGQAEGFDLATLGGMLLDSYGQLSRRLALHANEDVATLPRYGGATWARGTASGGGLYPISVYWVAGPSGPLTPGVYYYSTTHHAMQCLLTGDVTAEVRAAVDARELVGETDQFLVLGCKFWQNSFKYNSFSYHVVTMDIGTIVETWRMWAGSVGRRVEPVLWFDETRLNRLLGVPNDQEAVFAVVPLAWRRDAEDTHHGTNPTARIQRGVRYTDAERSRELLTFPTLERIQAAALAEAAQRPAPGALSATAARSREALADAEVVSLPPRRPLDIGVRRALRVRRSSFGRFTQQPGIQLDQLSTILAAGASGARFPCEITGAAGAEFTKMYVFANHVVGLDPGAYEHDQEAGSLRLVRRVPPGEFLQRNYFLANYNLEQAGAVIVPTARASTVVRATGDRGLRLVNATIGAMAQAIYTTSAALGLGCGAALGFDNISYIEELDLVDTDEAPLLILMVGTESPATANFRYEIV